MDIYDKINKQKGCDISLVQFLYNNGFSDGITYEKYSFGHFSTR